VNQKVAQLQLKKLGLSADLAGDGREALRALHNKPYRVVLMDCQIRRWTDLSHPPDRPRKRPARQPGRARACDCHDRKRHAG